MLLSLRRQVILDLDSTVLTVYGRQQKAANGYNPRKCGRPSYLAVLCFEGQTRDCLEGELHPGNTHVLSVIQPLIERALGKVPALKRLVVRADAAFYDGRFRRWLEGRRAPYVIAARLTSPIKYRVAGLRYRRVRQEISTAEFRYCPQGWSQTAREVRTPS